jgi:peptidoglycan/LPS O-acetylase OafA/YrhL
VSRDQGGYRPGLDGIRAIAVGAVLWFHLGRLGGGNLGVDAFFVVSGWLITWKLLNEADRSGRISLPSFWVARARRLMPAAMAVLVVTAVVWPLAGMQVPALRRDLLFAAGWASNWGTITSGGDYWSRFGDPSPVAHFWSLAIEEQYYLIWPIVLAAVVAAVPRRLRRVAVATVSTGLAVASIVAMNAMFDASAPTATYMNTFARAHSLLIGAAVAAGTTVLADGRLRGGRLARGLAPIGAIVAIGVVAAVSAAGAGDESVWLYRWGFPLFALAVAPVVVAAADGAGSRVLASRPMAWIADRSYGIYLWHWPTFRLLTPERVGISTDRLPIALLDLCRVGVAVALADASYRWLETPVRHRRRLVAWRGLLAAGLATTSLAVLAIAVVPSSPATSSDAIVTLPPPPVDAEASPSRDAEDPTSMPEVASLPPAAPQPSAAVPHDRSADATDSPTDAGASAAPDAARSPGAAVIAGADVPSAFASSSALGRPLRVLVTGDSTALHLSEALIAHAVNVPDRLVVGSGAFPGCGLSAAADGRMHAFTDTDGTRDLIDLSGCLRQWESVPQRIVDEAVDVVIVEIGPWDAVDIRLADGRLVSVADPTGRDLIATAYRDFATRVTEAGARLVWVTPADTHLGWGSVDDPLNDPERWTALRDIVDDLTATLGVTQIDLPGWLSALDLTGPEARPDGVHLGPGLNERFVVDEVAPGLDRAAVAVAVATALATG